MVKEGLNSQSDHDLLINTVTLLDEVRTKIIKAETLLDVVRINQMNHLEHHRKHDLIMLSVTLASVFTAMIAVASSLLVYLK